MNTLLGNPAARKRPSERLSSTIELLLQDFGRLTACLLVASSLLIFGMENSALAEADDSIEFRGQVIIPPEAVLRGKRISLTLLHVGTSFHDRERANSKGEFRFKDIPPGVYSLSIVIPGAGEMRTTVVLTPTFADDRGRVEKRFVFDAEALAKEAFPLRQGVVSVRELSIPRKARN